MKIEFVQIIGYIAAALTTFASIPQLIKIIKTRETRDISLIMYLMVVIGVFLWLIYGIMLLAPPIILANGITLVLMGTIVVLKIKHG